MIGQSADNDQKALAGALTVQEKPSNENISVRVLSPGDGRLGDADEHRVLEREGRQPQRDEADG